MESLDIINIVIKDEYFQNIINNDEFYFEKLKQLYNDYKNYNIEPFRNKLENYIDNPPENFKYQNMLDVNTGTPFFDYLVLIGKLISIFDEKGYNGNEWNPYVDKRRISKANFTQRNWTYCLFKYKLSDFSFEGFDQKTYFAFYYTIKYIEDPVNNVSITSQNHRQQICDYFKLNGENELITLFPEYISKLKNPMNKGFLITSVLYNPLVKKLWLDEVIGLMASDGTGWQNRFIQEMANFDQGIIWNSKIPSGKRKTLKFLRAIIDEGKSFNLYYSAGKMVTHKARVIDFVTDQQELSNKNWKTKGEIYDFKNDFKEYKENNKSARIVFLVDLLEKTKPISVSEFEFYNGYSEPRQDNLSPIKKEPIQTMAINKSKLFSDIAKALKLELENDPKTKDLFFFKEIQKYYVWIKDSYNVIGDSIAHYEIIEKKGKIFVELHFEGKMIEKNQFLPVVNDLPENLNVISWSRGKSISFGNGNSFDSPGLIKDLKYQLCYLENEIGDRIREIIKGFGKEIITDFPLNQILFGPPGTGKTYNTILKAAEIIEKKRGLAYNEAFKVFESRLHDKIEFITFHQNYSYEDFIQGLRPDVTNESGLCFEKKDGIFKQIADKALKNLKDSEREKIKPDNYVLIIDEINRANISRVFGELITLIECDKRSHGKIPIPVKLPSGDEFIVPSNLYIIGTMNTADKSIALLDIALRRRFEFVPMYPLYEIVGKTIYDAKILEKINEQIITKKGHDFQIGHSYFMDEETPYNLVERMNKKVIPLLLEYFMNDRKEVEEILSKAGLQLIKDSWPIQISAS